MKNTRLLFILIIVLTLTLTVGVVAFTFAWYTQRQTTNHNFNIEADGFLVIAFDENPELGETVLDPAVAMPYAVRDNLYMDVLTAYDASSDNPSYISKIATVAEYVVVLNYYNEDETLNPQCNLIFSVSAECVMKNGETSPINIDKELSITMTANTASSDGTVTESEIIPGQPLSLSGNSSVTITLSVYILLPDELCDPALTNGNLHLELSVVSQTSSAV